jgi:ribonuclease P protein component
VVALNKGAIRRKAKESFQNFQKTLARLKVVLLPAERHTNCESNETKKQEEHVPRHIELTAVLRDLKTKNRE